MSPKQIYKYDGRDVTGESVAFETKGEQWSEYVLTDGSLMKLKTVLMDVVRLDDEYTAQGDPVYMFTAQQVLGVVPNPDLKKKAN
jgi:hypothetical protein